VPLRAPSELARDPCWLLRRTLRRCYPGLSRFQLSQNLRQLPTPVYDGRPLRSGIAITPLHSVTVACPSSWSKTFVHWRENPASACNRKYGPSTTTTTTM